MVRVIVMVVRRSDAEVTSDDILIDTRCRKVQTSRPRPTAGSWRSLFGPFGVAQTKAVGNFRSLTLLIVWSPLEGLSTSPSPPLDLDWSGGASLLPLTRHYNLKCLEFTWGGVRHDSFLRTIASLGPRLGEIVRAILSYIEKSQSLLY